MCNELLPYHRYVYLMMNKAAGYLTATEDKKAATVFDLLETKYHRMGVFPVGRLDKDSEGLLLLTNDGELAHRLLSPKNHVDKLYYIRYQGTFDGDAPKRFAEGLHIDGNYQCMPAKLELLPEQGAYVTVQEGRYHQVKRMVQACGAEVAFLKRLAIGPLRLDEELHTGAYRELTEQEVQKLVICSKQPNQKGL